MNRREAITVRQIIELAVEYYKPVKTVLMVSGGHDSITNAHASASALKDMGIDPIVYHGDTTIGIPETQQYVRNICSLYGWQLFIRKPPKKEDWYDSIVAKYGFPGPTRSSHQFMYRRLKERGLRAFVTQELKSGRFKRENVLLLSGVRKDESLIRMGYSETMSKDSSRCWANPIFYWSEQDCKDYMAAHSIPLNPVKERICISGECLCGAFASREEYAEICAAYPSVGKRLKELHQVAIDNGHPWDWASGPNEWKKSQRQIKMPMCVGCEKKYEQQLLF